MKLRLLAIFVLLSLPAFADTYTGIVSEVKHFHDGGIAVDLGGKFPREKMILYVPAENVSTVGNFPSEGAKVTASGTIAAYHGVPEIKIYEASQWWSWQNAK